MIMKKNLEKNAENFSLLSKFKKFEILNLESIKGGKDGDIDKPINDGVKPPK